MHLPRFMRRVNRAFTNPLMGTFAWLVPPLAIVHHVGRRSGRRYRTPVVAFPSAQGFTIPMTYGRNVDWGRNLPAPLRPALRLAQFPGYVLLDVGEPRDRRPKGTRKGRT